MGREPGSGSIKKVIEMKNANNSRSGRGPDPLIIPKATRKHTDSDSRVRIQEFLWVPQIRKGPFSGSSWAATLLMKGYLSSRASGGSSVHHLPSHSRTMVLPCGSGTPQSHQNYLFSYHFYGNPLISYSLDGHPLQPGPWVLGVPPECLDAWLDHSMNWKTTLRFISDNCARDLRQNWANYL